MLKRTFKLFVLGLLTQGAIFPDQPNFPDPGSQGFDLNAIRVPGILQRIAWAYFVVSMMAIYFPKYGEQLSRDARFETVPQTTRTQRYFSVFRYYAVHWLFAILVMAIYIVVMLGLHVPSYSYTDVAKNVTYHQTCDTRGDLSPGAC